MKNNKTFIILIAVFIAVLVGAGILYNSLSDEYGPASLATADTAPNTTTSEGTSDPAATTDVTDAAEATTPKVPDFTVTDEAGNLVDLYDFLGKPIILNFWASWCGPCRSEMPDIQKAYETYGQDIHFLIVNLTDGSRETVDAARDYITQAGYTFPVYFDTTLHAASVYGAYSIPMTFFIGAEGQPIARYSGAMPADILQQGIDMLLNK